MQTANLSLYLKSTPVSLHISGGYTGDNADDFSISGRSRFTRGYLQYGKIGSKFNARIGRFFLYRGAAIGVLDGVESRYSLSHGVNFGVFAGIWGPFSREFEFGNTSDAFSFGAELGWMPSSVPFAKLSRFTISYANLQRNGEHFRERINFQNITRFSSGLTWYNSVQTRATASPLRRIVSRLRYGTRNTWNGMLEFGLISPDVSDASWFSGFESESITRLRFSADRWVYLDKLGFGLDGILLMKEKSGMRIGPALHCKYGVIGYRFSFGDQPKIDGPWAQAKVDLPFDFQVYANGSLTSYEWEAFDIESRDLVAFQSGFQWNPAMISSIGFMTEYQLYRSPKLDNDHRIVAGIQYRFDTAGADDEQRKNQQDSFDFFICILITDPGFICISNP